jgi:hypothetical protein
VVGRNSFTYQAATFPPKVLNVRPLKRSRAIAAPKDQARPQQHGATTHECVRASQIATADTAACQKGECRPIGKRQIPRCIVSALQAPVQNIHRSKLLRR